MTQPFQNGSVLFAPLPKWRAPWSELVLSYGAQAAILAVAFWVPVLTPQIIQPKKDYHAIELVPTPVPVNTSPQHQLPPPVLKARLDPVDPPATAMRLPAPRPQPRPQPKAEDAPVPEVKITSKQLQPLPAPTVVMPKQGVKTNVFSTGSSAPQTIERAAEKVQTGGFGDPNGVAAKTSQTRAVNIAAAGGFDLPTGPGSGNGTAGANGVKGVVASSGFGNGVATGSGRTSGGSGLVHQAGFGDADVAAPPTVKSRLAEQVASSIPAEILSKPIPVYTDEARQRRIEGEVLLEVVFEASGRLRVLRVVRGLGHGLDDAAVQAAQQIRFKPALKNGQPFDSTAVVHIIFQLA